MKSLCVDCKNSLSCNQSGIITQCSRFLKKPSEVLFPKQKTDKEIVNFLKGFGLK